MHGVNCDGGSRAACRGPQKVLSAISTWIFREYSRLSAFPFVNPTLRMYAAVSAGSAAHAV